MRIGPARSVNGRITLPGDKSISHRAAMIAAICEGETRIGNFAPGHDCESTLTCLRSLGVDIRRDGSSILVRGVGKTGLARPSHALDCGNSGTTMRLLAGILAGQPFESTLTGDESLLRRPMQRIIDPLERMGGVIDSDRGFPPLAISGRRLRGIEYELPVASAQVKSCILLAGSNAEGETTVVETTHTRDHTERMLARFGADLSIEGLGITVCGDTTLKARDVDIPGDISAAAFFIAAAACLKDSELVIENVGVNPTRTQFVELLESCGLKVQKELSNDGNEPAATLRVSSRTLMAPAVIDGETVAGLIDEIPILAVLSTQIGGIEIREAGELRHKETDRIAAIVENLTRMGSVVTEFPDGFRVEASRLKGANVESFGDHRIAMAFAIAALFADGETEIKGAECVAVSDPAFFETLAAVVR